ncbi:MAG: ComF family protein [Gammaproteobacteria bacterium]|nr:ComF family protein [Gammaproteobacteria bacterium]
MAKVDDWLAWLVPRQCVLCQAPSGPRAICAGCWPQLPWLGPACPSCGAWLGPTAPAGRCPRCASGRPVRLRLRAALAYAWPVDRLITGAKFQRRLHFAQALGELLAAAVGPVAAGPDRPDVIVPVPLHRRRLVERGYNQALEIAAPLADALGLPLAPRLCERRRHTPEQTGLSARARRRNLRGAFAVRGRCAGARIALVDDVITTGSTVTALAQALRAAGAAHVEAWAVARTL